MDTLLVEETALKLALGISDDSEDDVLSLYESWAVTYVEEQTGRRFQRPEERIEVLEGSGTRTLYLNGHLADPDTVSADVPVRERLRQSVWEDLDEDDYEVRGDALVRLDGYVWSRSADYEITYDDGYDTAPVDIQALVIEMVGILRTQATLAGAVTAGSAGLVEQEIDGYRYKLDASAVSTAASAATSLSTVGNATLERWRRRYV